jgi:hypothetical protein
MYDADGLYTIDSTQHSPLLGFAYDGFPVYGAYAYENTNGTGNIVRMKSSYHLRNITTRDHYADGSSVTPGPAVSSTYPLGYFREDYEYIPTTSSTPDYLDEHNGRFCVTPEYPSGIYCYFATVDSNWNSAYPYIVGPTYYGQNTAAKVASITESTTVYSGTTAIKDDAESTGFNVFTATANDLVVIQKNNLNTENVQIELFDMKGSLVDKTCLYQGSTIAFFDTKKFYAGEYLINIHDSGKLISKKIMIIK